MPTNERFRIRLSILLMLGLALLMVASPSLAMADDATGLELVASEGDSIAYIDADGEAQTCDDYTVLTADMTLLTSGWYVAQGSVRVSARVRVNGDAHIILCDRAKYYASLGITVSEGNSLTIYGQTAGAAGPLGQLNVGNHQEQYFRPGVNNPADYHAAIGVESGPDTDGAPSGSITINGGKVSVQGGRWSAGIGGGYDCPAGTITINDGLVYAWGGFYGGPGIGGGNNSTHESHVDAGTVIINGGEIHAEASALSNDAAGGAGIGGGFGGSGGIITITDGKVIAIGGVQSAGIGGGSSLDPSLYPGGDGGTISITGGDITSMGGQFGAGIGGAVAGSGGDITITGGTIEATGGAQAAGIGGGQCGGGGSVRIEGGEVLATAGTDDGAAGIGGGHSGDGGDIVIADGSVVAQGAYGGAGIGSGFKGQASVISLQGGCVDATGGAYAAGIGGGYRSGASILIAGGQVTASGGEHGIGIGTISPAANVANSVTFGWTDKDQDRITASSYPSQIAFDKWFAYEEDGRRVQPPVAAGKTIVPLEYQFVTVCFDSKGGSSIDDQTVVQGECVQKPEAPTLAGHLFKEWLLDGEPYDFSQQVTGDIELEASYWRTVAAPQGRTDLVYNGTVQTGVAAGTGYTLSGDTTGTEARSYEATAVLQDGYAWTDGSTAAKAIAFRITAAEITKATIADQYATGKAIAPTPTVTAGKLTLKKTDYTVSYKNNVKPGTATATVKGTGNFAGTLTANFTIHDRWQRLAGANAIATMQAIVRADGVFAASSVDTIVVAGRRDFKAALAGTGLAGLYRAPLLITEPASLSTGTKTELQRLKPKTIYVCGNTSVVSASTYKAIVAAVPGAKVKRISGTSPSATATAIHKAGKSASTKWGKSCVVATQSSYKDALSIAPYAYAKHAPIFFTESTKLGDGKKLSSATLSAIKSGGFSKVIVVGGTLAVPDSVKTQLKGITVKRIAGKNAIETSRLVAQFGLSQGMRRDHLAVATTSDFADALSGAALAGAQNNVLVLANKSGGYGAFDAVCNSKELVHGHILGGPAALSASAETHFRKK